eukprot:8744935-Ditylum_brightwellii.AAC.1
MQGRIVALKLKHTILHISHGLGAMLRVVFHAILGCIAVSDKGRNETTTVQQVPSLYPGAHAG